MELKEYGRYRLLGTIAPLVVILDQWTKYLVHTRFRWGESIEILGSFFALTYVRNSGAAFGLLHRAPPQFRDPFFIVVPIVALIVIFVIYVRLTREQKLTAWALSLIVGGALGNLVDRLRFGYVIDFLDFHWKEVYHWPAFNVADSCIVVGVSLMFLQSLFPGAGVLKNVHDRGG
jgi:signal peptidase II